MTCNSITFCIAVLAENQYQELELWYPVMRFREAGAAVTIVGPVAGQVYGSKLGYPVVPDVSVDDVDPADFDCVIVPGGFSPESLRRNAGMLDLVRKVEDNGRIVAAICHALLGAGLGRAGQGPSPHLRLGDQGRRHQRRGRLRR